MDKAKQIAEYVKMRGRYESFAASLEQLFQTLLHVDGIRYHVVESRAKTIDSFEEKISRTGKDYKDPLKDISDLCGCRIIVFYADDVQRVADLIRKEFKVVEEETSHQPEGLDVDRFGYLSLHCIIELKSDRYKLAEWRPMKGLRAEIQIRTVIQHAWSAVSHALQYKTETLIPSKLRRRLHRIAGLFELADEEFVGIRDQRAVLEQEAAKQIALGNNDLELTSTSIEQSVRSWPELDSVIALALDSGFLPGEFNGNMISDIYELATKAGVNTVGELLSAVRPVNPRIFEALERRDWYADADFLFFLQLLARFPRLLSQEDFVRNGWEEGVAAGVIRAAASANA